uniref:CSON001127 protein n=1 Tax=Culicoides sonorensis TaxID=179676 RepID=A0A336KZP7_CULSO
MLITLTLTNGDELNGKENTADVAISNDADLDEYIPEESSRTEEYIPDYRGSQLWKIQYNTKVLKPLEKEAYAQVWNFDKKHFDVLVHGAGVEKAKEILKNANVNYTVQIDDLKKAISEENPPKKFIQELMNRNGLPMTWRAYHRLDDIHKYLDFIAKNNPDLVTTQTIGYSRENRTLKIVRISNNNPGNKAIWIDGGIHAREWISPASVTFIINELIEEWEDKPDYIRKIDWYILPVTNPDGYEYSHTTDRLWRKSRANTSYPQCKGVDLNRNYGYKWGGKGVSKSPCTEIFGGTGGFSEPETKAIRDFLTGLGTGKVAGSISFHSYGQYILYPWGYDRVVPPDHKDLETLAVEARQKMAQVSGNWYTVGPAAASLYPASGGSDDWAKGQMGIKYAYTLELPDNGRYGFVLPASYITGAGRESMAFADTLAKYCANLKHN